MGRGCITYSIAYLLGIICGSVYSTFTIAPLILTPILLAFAASTRKNALLFLIFSHLAIFCSGAGSYIYAKGAGNLLPDRLSSSIAQRISHIQTKTTDYLEKFTTTNDAHSTLCALTVGRKEFMDKELKQSYSRSGAMHILALSGLHIGIIYSILGHLCTPLSFLGKGKIIKDLTALVLIFIYTVITGCSPSSVRATTMIIIYRFGIQYFRDISKWDALAVSAIVIGAIAPWQVTSIGFQLSYAAVIGIGAFYPVCRNAFSVVTGIPLTSGRPIQRIGLKIWENISISICCQIATLPLLLFYFGTGSPYFLITNLIAVPLATVILHIFSIAFILQWVPFINDILASCLNFMIELLNSSILFIST